jgi:alkylation response protein AidB-like acyl-CoA dehydrogenase
MFIDLTPEQKKLRDELRSYFDALMTPERKAATRGMEGGKSYRESIRQIGKDGWLGVGWPKEFGGGGRTMVEQLIFLEEQRRANAPFPFVTVSIVGPALMEHGTEEQKAEFLTRILQGECHFSIGYSEPEAGTRRARTTPTTSGSRPAPIPMPRSTRASRSSSCPPTARDSAPPSSTPSAARRPR